jgi:hypothetical protein
MQLTWFYPFSLFQPCAGQNLITPSFLINSILPVSNVSETAKFYEEKLGFEIEILWENPQYGGKRTNNNQIRRRNEKPRGYRDMCNIRVRCGYFVPPELW